MIISRADLEEQILHRRLEADAPAFYALVPFVPPEYPNWRRAWAPNGSGMRQDYGWRFDLVVDGKVVVSLWLAQSVDEETIAETLAIHSP